MEPGETEHRAGYQTGDVDEANSLSPVQLAAFLTAMRTHYPQHYALVVLLA